VTNPRHPLRINVGFLLNQPVGTSRDIHFDFADINLSPDFNLKQLTGVLRLNRTPQGILIDGAFNGLVPVECVRCMEPFDQALHTAFQELYSFHSHPTVEDSMVIAEDGNIDFSPIVREYLVLEVPIKSLCREDCKGLCIECGENLNIKTCAHQSQVFVK
jgi:uncharacterized protein